MVEQAMVKQAMVVMEAEISSLDNTAQRIDYSERPSFGFVASG